MLAFCPIFAVLAALMRFVDVIDARLAAMIQDRFVARSSQDPRADPGRHVPSGIRVSACGLILLSAATIGIVAGSPAVAMPKGGNCDLPSARKKPRCRRAAAARVGRAPAPPAQAKGHPAIEAGGTMPGIDNVVPLLRPGTFRVDMSAYYASYPLFGIGAPRNGPGSSVMEVITLGYGVNDRLTIFGSALESNVSHRDGDYSAAFVDPRVGFVYRVLQSPSFWSTTLDFVGDVTVNEPLHSPSLASGPYGDLGPILRARFLATRELGHGFTLQLSAGLQGATVMTSAGGAANGGAAQAGNGTGNVVSGNESMEADVLLGLGGQYRLSALSDRLYVNGELDWLKPVTDNNGTSFIASPFRTAEMYSATLGSTYVVKPGFALVRLSDTLAVNVVNANNLFPPTGPRHFVSNTVGLTLSFVNLTPATWVAGLTH